MYIQCTPTSPGSEIILYIASLIKPILNLCVFNIDIAVGVPFVFYYCEVFIVQGLTCGKLCPLLQSDLKKYVKIKEFSKCMVIMQVITVSS